MIAGTSERRLDRAPAAPDRRKPSRSARRRRRRAVHEIRVVITSSETGGGRPSARSRRASRRSGRWRRSRGRGSRPAIAPAASTADDEQHLPGALAVAGVEVLLGEVGLLAVEHEAHQPHRVHAGEERADQPAGPHADQRAWCPCRALRRGSRPWTRGKNPISASVPTHISHLVLGSAVPRPPILRTSCSSDMRVDHDARAEEEQRLEEGVGEQVEHALGSRRPRRQP